MLSTNLNNLINNDPIDDVLSWLSDNIERIAQVSDSLFTRFRELHVGGCDINSIDINTIKRIVSILFMNNPRVTEIEFNLLSSVAQAIYTKNNEFTLLSDEIENDRDLVLYVLLLEPQEIIKHVPDDEVLKVNSDKLYGYLLDTYIPCDNPEELISYFNEITSFKEILGNLNDTNWFNCKYDESGLSTKVPLKDVLILFKYVSDIYLNKTMKLEFFFKLHALLTRNYAFREKLNEIVLRYEKIFHEDTSLLILELVDLDQSDMDSFLYRWCRKYHANVNSAVMKCIIDDCSALSKYSNHEIDYSSIKSSLIPKWDEPAYYCDPMEKEEELLDTDTPITTLQEIAMEAVHKDSAKMNDTGKKIYKAYRTYQSAEEKVDSQVSKALGGIKRVLTGDVRSEIIEGKKFSAIKLLKRLLGTVAIFSTSKIAGVVGVVVGYALKKKTSESERRKIIMELETEISMITEKIEDARGDNNREAKYSMMRTKKELENALKRIQYGMDADSKSTSNAKKTLDAARNSM